MNRMCSFVWHIDDPRKRLEMPDSPDRPTDDTLETQMPGDEPPPLRDLLTRAREMGLAPREDRMSFD